MFEKFTSADAPDFRQRYLGTYGFFRRNGKSTLARLDEIDTQSGRKTVSFVNSSGENYVLYADSPEEDTGFEFLPPKSSFYNCDNGAVCLVKRVATKQYLRGICSRNTSITFIDGKKANFGFDILNAIFNTHATPESQFNRWKEGSSMSSAVALSPSFALDFSNGLVKCFESTIGAVSYKTGKTDVKVSLDDDLFLTEMRDAVARANIPVEVSVCQK